MSGRPLLEAALRRFDFVELPELLVAAELLTRVDRKYVIDQALVPELLDRLDPAIQALEIDDARTFTYESVYFDTPELIAYHESARRRPDRFKVRSRAYLDSDSCSLEVKTRDPRGLTIKERIPYEVADRGRLTADGLAFVRTFDAPARHASRYAPSMITRYFRSTLLLSADTRATIDVDLGFVTPDGREAGGWHWAVIESKSMARPTVVDRALWSMGHRPIAFSKYCVGLALHSPQLPANHWNRPLRHLLGWTPDRERVAAAAASPVT